jgi:hypothetical protein
MYTAFHLAIIAASTISAGAMGLTALIAVTGRNLW